MERNGQKRRLGFMKSIFRASKPVSALRCSSSKVKPNPPSQFGHWGVQKEENLVNPSLMPKPYSSAAKSLAGLNGTITGDVHAGPTDRAASGEENVDMKAAKYISNVRERFKLVNVDLDQRMYQEMR
ncbi:hypothetical protein CJ030_MR0G004522 [Morella rubra]|uniref:Uncharacterized protein n=1 Tax=Morella rubra TaxID=262757 RepID=A0A6A1UM01_9ROSI|nr:hypothetical protein CJ030_MR0G004522 [Morella rubra]